jgi:hypothetical protein
MTELWTKVFPMVLPPDPDARLGFILLNSNADIAGGEAIDSTRTISSRKRTGPSGTPASSLSVGDFVIAAAQELDETKAVTEGIGHMGDAAPSYASGSRPLSRHRLQLPG